MDFLLSKHRDGKVDQIQSPSSYKWSPCHQPVPLQSTFYIATRLSLKTKWLCHSQGSDFCRFNNILMIKLKYECYLVALNPLLCHDQYIMPSLLCVGNAWSKPNHWFKMCIIITCSGNTSAALARWGWAPSSGCSQTKESPHSQGWCKVTISEWLLSSLVPWLFYKSRLTFFISQIPIRIYLFPTNSFIIQFLTSLFSSKYLPHPQPYLIHTHWWNQPREWTDSQFSHNSLESNHLVLY